MNIRSSYRIQLTGPSGSGKTYVADNLARLGYHAVDADVIDGLGHFLDRDDNVREYDNDGGLAWLNDHTWSWDREVLEAYIYAHPRVIICGGAANDVEMGESFDFVFYLVAPKEVILSNLMSPERFNPYGKTEAQQEFASTMIDRFYASVPADWKPLQSRDPRQLIVEMEQYIGAVLDL